MTKKRIATKKHVPPARDDIILAVGDEVTIGKEFDGNPNWKNWIWCESKNSHQVGWVPKQYVHINGQLGEVLKDYSSRELPVQKGDELIIGFHMNGWVWCTDSSGTQGWVPDENFE